MGKRFLVQVSQVFLSRKLSNADVLEACQSLTGSNGFSVNFWNRFFLVKTNPNIYKLSYIYDFWDTQQTRRNGSLSQQTDKQSPSGNLDKISSTDAGVMSLMPYFQTF